VNLENIFTGIVIVLIGLLFDILLLTFNKKIKSPWIVFGITLLCDIIAFLLWSYVPGRIMPHCLECLLENDGYMFDKNKLKTFTIIINSIIGVILLSGKYKAKKGLRNIICQILSILGIFIAGILLLSMSYA